MIVHEMICAIVPVVPSGPIPARESAGACGGAGNPTRYAPEDYEDGEAPEVAALGGGAAVEMVIAARLTPAWTRASRAVEAAAVSGRRASRAKGEGGLALLLMAPV